MTLLINCRALGGWEMSTRTVLFLHFQRSNCLWCYFEIIATSQVAEVVVSFVLNQIRNKLVSKGLMRVLIVTNQNIKATTFSTDYLDHSVPVSLKAHRTWIVFWCFWNKWIQNNMIIITIFSLLLNYCRYVREMCVLDFPCNYRHCAVYKELWLAGNG